MRQIGQIFILAKGKILIIILMYGHTGCETHGQWLWLSFGQQMSEVQIQSSANFYIEHCLLFITLGPVQQLSVANLIKPLRS